MRIPIPFAGAFSERTAKAVSSQTCVNWYPDIVETHGGQMMTLKMRSGLILNQSLTVGPHRGSIVHAGEQYVVSNNIVYKIDSLDVATQIGTINTYSGFVGMASSGFQLVIVDGSDGFYWNGTVFAQITDVDFVDAVQVKFLKGRFIVNAPGTGRFHISANYDASSWAALDYATAEVDPDNLIAIEIDHQELWLFGEFTTEQYFYSGNTLFPFEPQPGAFTEWGCVAPWSVAKADNGLTWLAQTRNGGRQVVQATMTNPTVISSGALEERINLFTTVSDAYSFVVKGADKHLFYVLTFPSANETHVYDYATKLWHGWESFGTGRFRIATHLYTNNKHYMGDSINGNLYTFDASIFSDNGTNIVRSRKTDHSSSNMDRLFCHSLELVMNVGQGLISGQGSDPQVALYYSDDGGNTFGNAHTESIGRIGEYANRVKFDQLGAYRHRVWEVRISDPVPTTLIGAFAEMSKER
jgi:hypothetical protein